MMFWRRDRSRVALGLGGEFRRMQTRLQKGFRWPLKAAPLHCILKDSARPGTVLERRFVVRFRRDLPDPKQAGVLPMRFIERRHARTDPCCSSQAPRGQVGEEVTHTATMSR